jgi:PadR family transcriptional regulator PadR
MGKQVDILQGTLDMLILKAVSLGPLHGYGILLRIQQVSKDALQIPQGSLYPALYRLEHRGWIAAEWGESENKRKAKYYRLTAAGRTAVEIRTAGVEAPGGGHRRRAGRGAGGGVTCWRK